MKRPSIIDEFKDYDLFDKVLACLTVLMALVGFAVIMWSLR